MSGIDWLKEEIGGATPLDPDEADGLIPAHISLVAQLNQWEHENILAAEEWALGRKRRGVLTERFVRQLHRRMFDQTWIWAGTYRTTVKNIGFPPYSVVTGVVDTVSDAAVWIEESVYSLDETAARVHHRLVSVHPFSNGNGRHARLFADTLLHQYDKPPLTWGRLSLGSAKDARQNYLAAVRAADKQDYTALMELARA